MKTVKSISFEESVELVKLLNNINVNGYIIERQRAFVRLFVTIHEGPFEIKEAEDRDFRVGLSDTSSCYLFLNSCILPQFFGYNCVKNSHELYNAMDVHHVKNNMDSIKVNIARIRSQTKLVNKKMAPEVKNRREIIYKKSIKGEVASACRLLKLNPVDFMQSILNEFVVESIVKS